MKPLDEPCLVEWLLVFGDLEHLRINHSSDQTLGFSGGMSLSLQALKCLPRGGRIAITNLVLASEPKNCQSSSVSIKA
jgi:hypothetical protein